VQSTAATAVAIKEGRTDPSKRIPKKLHGYFLGFTAIFALLVVWGFSRTFFIPVARGTYSRPLVVHIHGALFFGWTILLFTQAWLAATRRLQLHRKIGSIAAWLVIPMLLMGTVVAWRDTIHDFYAGDGDAALSFFYGELADLTMFGLLAGGAMLIRSKPEFHKRWVILGSLGLLGAAIGRISSLQTYGMFIVNGLAVSVALYDLASRRAIHAATWSGLAVLFVIGLTEVPIGNTPGWISLAHHLLGI
jgi:hypothetical protein